MSVLIDTNIWLDVVLERKNFALHSRGAIGVCIMENIDIQVPGTSLKDVFYIVAKIKGTEQAYSAIKTILEFARVAPIDEAVCRQALEFEEPDYEDGIIAAAALLNKVDGIITRDVDAFNDLSVKKFRPEEFISAQGYTEIEF